MSAPNTEEHIDRLEELIAECPCKSNCFDLMDELIDIQSSYIRQLRDELEWERSQ